MTAAESRHGLGAQIKQTRSDMKKHTLLLSYKLRLVFCFFAVASGVNFTAKCRRFRSWRRLSLPADGEGAASSNGQNRPPRMATKSENPRNFMILETSEQETQQGYPPIQSHVDLCAVVTYKFNARGRDNRAQRHRDALVAGSMIKRRQPGVE